LQLLEKKSASWVCVLEQGTSTLPPHIEAEQKGRKITRDVVFMFFFQILNQGKPKMLYGKVFPPKRVYFVLHCCLGSQFAISSRQDKYYSFI